MAIVEVKVPYLSESVAEATMMQWKKKAGMAVAIYEILIEIEIEIETDKVILEVPAPAAGVLYEIVVCDGGTVTADQLIARIDTEGTAGAVSAAPIAAPAAAAPDMSHCLINQAACGREAGNPVCPKCGMDERVVYPSEADREAAQERAEGTFWKAHAALLAAQLASLSSMSTSTPEITGVGLEERVPDIGDFTDVAVIELFVKPGDYVKPEQSLVTVESDKASMEIPASRSGVIQSLHIKVGDKVSQGSLIALIAAPAAGQIIRDAPWAPEMVVLPSGKFLMGSSVDDPHGFANQRPQHEVTIGYTLALGKYPVTFEEWDACVADGGTRHKPEDQGWGRGKRPVINVSWHYAQEYVAWVNQRLGIASDDPSRYRLPSEAEWEYACQAGTKGLYSTPDGLMSEKWANYDASHTYEGEPAAGRKSDKTTPVGIYPANSWGLHDMHGNVREWVQDGYEDSYQGAPSDGSAWESGSSRRVCRGGAWHRVVIYLGSSVREGREPSYKYQNGFRIARTVP